LVHNRLFPEGAIVRVYETIEAAEWAMGYMDPKTPGVGTLAKIQSQRNQMPSKRLISSWYSNYTWITSFANEHKHQLGQDNLDRGLACKDAHAWFQ
jgi:hypothetical protein